jgi:hypothetical protein
MIAENVFHQVNNSFHWNENFPRSRTPTSEGHVDGTETVALRNITRWNAFTGSDTCAY